MTPPLPASMAREDVASWLCFLLHPQDGRSNGFKRYTKPNKDKYRRQADAVRALVEAKVRETIRLTEVRCSLPEFADKSKAYGFVSPGATDDEIVARVMGGPQ